MQKVTKAEFEKIMVETNYGYRGDVECPNQVTKDYEFESVACNLGMGACERCWRYVLNNYPWDEEIKTEAKTKVKGYRYEL